MSPYAESLLTTRDTAIDPLSHIPSLFIHDTSHSTGGRAAQSVNLLPHDGPAGTGGSHSFRRPWMSVIAFHDHVSRACSRYLAKWERRPLLCEGAWGSVGSVTAFMSVWLSVYLCRMLDLFWRTSKHLAEGTLQIPIPATCFWQPLPHRLESQPIFLVLKGYIQSKDFRLATVYMQCDAQSPPRTTTFSPVPHVKTDRAPSPSPPTSTVACTSNSTVCTYQAPGQGVLHSTMLLAPHRGAAGCRARPVRHSYCTAVPWVDVGLGGMEGQRDAAMSERLSQRREAGDPPCWPLLGSAVWDSVCTMLCCMQRIGAGRLEQCATALGSAQGREVYSTSGLLRRYVCDVSDVDRVISDFRAANASTAAVF